MLTNLLYKRFYDSSSNSLYPSKHFHADTIQKFPVKVEKVTNDKPEELSKSSKNNSAQVIRMNMKAPAAQSINRRNIYKSIVRNMTAYSRSHRDELIEKLLKIGYEMKEIEHAFFDISRYKEIEEYNDDRKKFKKLLDGITRTKSVRSYILKESLRSKVGCWERGKQGRIASHNFEAYKKVYLTYYKASSDLEEGKNGEILRKKENMNM